MFFCHLSSCITTSLQVSCRCKNDLQVLQSLFQRLQVAVKALKDQLVEHRNSPLMIRSVVDCFSCFSLSFPDIFASSGS